MALPTKLTLEIVTPDRALVREEVDEIQIPGARGSFGVLPGHTPLLTLLGVGALWYRVRDTKRWVAVAGGFVEVLPDRVAVLADAAERAEDIDVPRAEAARARADGRLSGTSKDVDLARARTSRLKAVTRLQVASHARARV